MNLEAQHYIYIYICLCGCLAFCILYYVLESHNQ